MGRLLLIDDEQPIVEMLSRALTRYGYIVDTATTLAAAEGLLGNQPDLVVCDGNIETTEGHDGAQYARDLQQRGYRVVMFSTYDYSSWGLVGVEKPSPAPLVAYIKATIPL